MTFPMIVHCDGVGLFLDREDEHSDLALVEGTDLGQLLEYTQPGSVRKQVLSDWKEHFSPGEDYVLEQFLGQRRHWAQRRKAANDGTLLEVVLGRKGRIFLTETGLAKFLARTSKPRSERLRLALAAASALFRAPDVDLESDPRALERAPLELESDPGATQAESSSSSITSDHPSSDPAQLLEPPGDPPRSPELPLEERTFRHHVRQTLLENVSKHRQDRLLLHLALSAAEEALGCSLGLDVELGLEPAPRPEASSRPTPAAPARESSLWLTMRAIGRLAGGYSAVAAGHAANTLAALRGVTAQEFRTRDTPFSRVRLHPDTSTGKLRPRVEFTEEFAKLVIDELRKSPAPARSRTLTEFDDAEGAELPKLSQPLELSGESSSFARPKLSQPLDLGDAH